MVEEPLRERGWELLATALYRAGRQGDALVVLRRARRTLAEQLGADPGPALRRLEAAILHHDETLTPVLAAAGPVTCDRVLFRAAGEPTLTRRCLWLSVRQKR